MSLIVLDNAFIFVLFVNTVKKYRINVSTTRNIIKIKQFGWRKEPTSKITQRSQFKSNKEEEECERRANKCK